MYFPFGRLPEQKSIRRDWMRSSTHRILLALIAMAVTLPVFAQQRIPLTLAEAEDLALAAEPGQKAMRARAAALEERAVIAGELPDPMLRVGLNNFPIESGGFRTEGFVRRRDERKCRQSGSKCLDRREERVAGALLLGAGSPARVRVAAAV